MEHVGRLLTLYQILIKQKTTILSQNLKRFRCDKSFTKCAAIIFGIIKINRSSCVTANKLNVPSRIQIFNIQFRSITIFTTYALLVMPIYFRKERGVSIFIGFADLFITCILIWVSINQVEASMQIHFLQFTSGQIHLLLRDRWAPNEPQKVRNRNVSLRGIIFKF